MRIDGHNNRKNSQNSTLEFTSLRNRSLGQGLGQVNDSFTYTRFVQRLESTRKESTLLFLASKSNSEQCLKKSRQVLISKTKTEEGDVSFQGYTQLGGRYLYLWYLSIILIVSRIKAAKNLTSKITGERESFRIDFVRLLKSNTAKMPLLFDSRRRRKFWSEKSNFKKDRIYNNL